MSTGKKRILIAEDERLLAARLEQMLREMGYEVAAAVASGEAAVEKALELLPDLALMDIGLQGEMDGIQAALAMREQVDLPVVYLTGYSDEETIQRAMITGPFGYLVKPFNARELRAAIEIAIYKHETDRLLAEEKARRRAVEEFKLFVEGVQHYGIFLLDTTGRVASWNVGAERIEGYRAEEIMGQECSVFFAPEDVEAGKPRALLDEAESRGRAEDEGWRIRKDGSRFWAHVVITALRDEAGLLRGFGKVVLDLTVRRQSELAVRESEQRKAAILDASFDPLITMDHQGNVVEFNRAAERVFGFRRADVVGKELASLIIPPRFRERHRRGLERYLRIGEGPILGKRTELPAIRADGTEFLAELAIEVIHPDGQPLFTGSIRDIGEQRRYETRRELMLEATTILASTLEREVLLAEVGRLTVPRVADWSEIDVVEPDDKLKCLGVACGDRAKLESFRGLENRHLFSPAAEHGTRHVIRSGESQLVKDIPEALLASFAQSTDHRALLQSLGLRSYLCVPIRTSGRVLGVITLATSGARQLDETDRAFLEQLANSIAIAMENARLYEEAQEQRRAAEEAVQARDAFLSVASHELRNPLSTLRMSIELFQRDPERGFHTAAKMRRQTHRLTELVDSLLDVSRITAGRLDLKYEEADLAAIVEDVVSRFEQETRRAGCEVSVQGAGSVVGVWDSMRLDQIVTNLLSNAVKYGAGKPISIRVEGSGESARLIVQDHGIGISPEDQSRIFERFERVGRVGAGRVGGLGLGLWIVRQITSALGGSVQVGSELGKGATFVIELPRTRAAELPSQPGVANEETLEEQEGQRHAEQVLVVEDDQDALDVISDLLRSHGYTVASAANGREALDYLTNAIPPRVILLDLTMPVMDGVEFLHEKERAPDLAAIPVVLVSADGQLARRADELQVAGFITKPVNVDQLFSTVERHCEAAPG